MYKIGGQYLERNFSRIFWYRDKRVKIEKKNSGKKFEKLKTDIYNQNISTNVVG